MCAFSIFPQHHDEFEWKYDHIIKLYHNLINIRKFVFLHLEKLSKRNDIVEIFALTHEENNVAVNWSKKSIYGEKGNVLSTFNCVGWNSPKKIA